VLDKNSNLWNLKIQAMLFSKVLTFIQQEFILVNSKIIKGMVGGSLFFMMVQFIKVNGKKMPYADSADLSEMIAIMKDMLKMEELMDQVIMKI
jgi:hypothetical protein